LKAAVRVDVHLQSVGLIDEIATFRQSETEPRTFRSDLAGCCPEILQQRGFLRAESASEEQEKAYEKFGVIQHKRV
jgi:hypothetical protein